MFRCTRDEAETVSRSRSQSVILKRGQNIKGRSEEIQTGLLVISYSNSRKGNIEL